MWRIINLIQLILISLHTVFMAVAFTWALPTRWIYFLANNIWSNTLIFFAGGKLKCTGRENIQRGKNYMFLSNHTSWIDIMVIMYSSQRVVRFIAKKELGRIPFLGYMMHRVGMIFVDRGNVKKSAKMVKETLNKIKNGSNIAAFPEGTRSKDGKLSQFKKGMFSIAIMAGIDIIPVGIVGASKVWYRNNHTFRPGTIEVNYGKPISISEYNESNIIELIERVRQEITLLSKQA